MDAFRVALTAVLPFIVYLTLGYMLNHHTDLVDTPFLRRLNTVVFRVFFPCLMFWNTYTIDRNIQFEPRILLIVGASLVIATVAVTFLVVRVVPENPKRSVVVQMICRGNFALFAIPLAESVCGSEGSAIASMLIPIAIPIYNAAAVILFEIFRGGKISAGSLIKNILKNPLIDGAITGLVFFALNLHLPYCLEVPVHSIGSMTTPTALIALGGTLEFSAIGKNLKYLVPCTFIRLVVCPIIATMLGLFVFHLPRVERFVFMLLWATPVATSIFPMAQNMGGDAELAGQAVVITTVAAIFSIFCMIFVFGTLGLV